MHLFNRPAARITTLATVVLLVSGCITIEEHYTFKKDGSGTMEYVMDASATADILNGLDMGGGKKEKDNSDDMGLKEKTEQLKALQGIRKVKLKSEHDDAIKRISFAFADIDALNKALNVLMKDSTGVQRTFFRWDGNTLVRTSNQQAEEMGTDLGKGSEGTELDSLLKSMKYKFSFTFPEAVAGTDLAPGMSKASPDPKTVDLATDWSWIMKDPKTLDLRITLAK